MASDFVSLGINEGSFVHGTARVGSARENRWLSRRGQGTGYEMNIIPIDDRRSSICPRPGHASHLLQVLHELDVQISAISHAISPPMLSRSRWECVENGGLSRHLRRDIPGACSECAGGRHVVSTSDVLCRMQHRELL